MATKALVGEVRETGILRRRRMPNDKHIGAFKRVQHRFHGSARLATVRSKVFDHAQGRVGFTCVSSQTFPTVVAAAVLSPVHSISATGTTRSRARSTSWPSGLC